MKKIKKISRIFAEIMVSALLFVASNYNLIAQEAGTVKDLDGNIYNTIRIGDQIWMAENLRSTRLNDGTAISNITGIADWAALSTPGYCWYKNDTVYKNVYGALYNAYAVNTNKLCPAGWHVSTNEDWLKLESYLGGEKIAGGKLKDTGTLHWSEPNSGATNEIQFNALPGGSRYTNGLFLTIKNMGYWWSPGETNTFNNWYRSIYYRDIAITRNFIDSTNGFSVRCVKD
ncbi:MAG: fibrobacter succinogenes major paralogous domain-containing protein [Bacteroidales bacterium]|nr:fibrobacter succinogenes major paralogous domain-containing protein [Bacteroidales bacterium]